MTVFVTGGLGFIGSNFSNFLANQGWEDIVILDKLTYAGNLKNIEFLDVQLERVDIKNIDNLDKLFVKYNPDFIFNFAAETHVDNSINNLYPFVDTNIVGTVNLLNLSVKYNVKRFHHISTDEVYGSLSFLGDPFTEKTQYNPLNPYSASKAASDHFVIAFGNTFGLSTMITNCSNNYGPRQHPEKLIPKTILNILRNKKIPIYGKGLNVRDWIYVEDHCQAIIDIFNNGVPGERYNIGGNCEKSNIELVKLIIKMMNASEDLIEFVEDRPGHDLRYAISNKKINEEIGWKPNTNIIDGLTKTIKWYETF